MMDHIINAESFIDLTASATAVEYSWLEADDEEPRRDGPQTALDCVQLAVRLSETTIERRRPFHVGELVVLIHFVGFNI